MRYPRKKKVVKRGNNAGTVRVVSGAYKGRILHSPATAHPMGSRERMALFNMLAPRLKNVRVLDLFAGSGALGIEALSRGARVAIFVDRDAQAARLIRENLRNLEVPDAASMVVHRRAEKYHPSDRLSVIFVDPPYEEFAPEKFSHVADFLADDGLVIVSHPDGAEFELPGLKITSRKRYAGCNLAFFEKI